MGRSTARTPSRTMSRRGRGQGIVEYGLILSLSTLLGIGILLFAGGAVADVLQLIADAVEASENAGR